MRTLSFPSVALGMLLAATVFAQPGIRIWTVNTNSPPRIQIRVVPTPPDLFRNEIYFTVLENGIRQEATVTCPEQYVPRNIVFCLDRSSSIRFDLPLIKQAVHSVINSLHSSDRVGLVTFTDKDSINHPLTTNHQSVHDAVDAFLTHPYTAFYDGVCAAGSMLTGVEGPNYIVLFTDGDDNISTQSLDDAVVNVQNANAVVIAIPYGNPKVGKDELKRLILLSNGFYFPATDTTTLKKAFADAANAFGESWCLMEYDAINCRDSVRAITVLAETISETYSADTVIYSPVSISTLSVAVEAPEEISPGSTQEIKLLVDGTLSSDLLRFYVRVRQKATQPVDLNLLDMKETETVFGNQSVSVQREGNDALIVSSNGVFPKKPNGMLFSFTASVPPNNSSRLLPFVIDSVYFAQSCPLKAGAFNDTMKVCTCVQPYTIAQMERTAVTSTGTFEIPIGINHPADPGTEFEFFADVRCESEDLRFLVAFWSDGMLYDPPLELTSHKPGYLALRGNNVFRSPSNPTRLVTLRFRAEQSFFPRPIKFTIENFRYFATCCPAGPATGTFHGLVDGICDKIVSRKPVAIATYPNPATDQHQVTITTSKESHVRLEMYATNGALQNVVYEGNISGSLTVNSDFRSSQGGCYYYVARTEDGATATKPFVVMR